MASFKRYTGTLGDASWPAGFTTIYTVPSAKKSVITGLTVCNVTAFELPVSIMLNDGTNDQSFLSAVHVPAGQSIKVTTAEKVVLEAGDTVKGTAPLIDGTGSDTFDVWLSVYEDV